MLEVRILLQTFFIVIDTLINYSFKIKYDIHQLIFLSLQKF